MLIEADLDACYADCPIIPLPNHYIVCFRAGDKFYIGEHQSWDIVLKKLAGLEGKTLSIRYDDAHVWVKLPSGWQVKLNQFYHEYPFRDKPCRSAAKMRSLEYGYTRPSSVTGEPASPLMHGQLVFAWALCFSSTKDRELNDCTVWDLSGAIRRKGIYRQVDSPSSSQQIEVSDETSDAAYKVLHLRDGRVLQFIGPTPVIHD